MKTEQSSTANFSLVSTFTNHEAVMLVIVPCTQGLSKNTCIFRET